MPLIVICGYPSSGKTYRAKQIVAYLEDKVNTAAPTLPDTTGSALHDSAAAADLADSVPAATRAISDLTLEKLSFSSNLSSSVSTTDNHSTVKDNAAQPARTSKAPNARKIYYISDHSLHLPRSAYSVAKSEKDARAALYSAVKRVLGRNDIIVLDSGNYIKGWRYQLYCEAKNSGTASCVVHVGVAGDKCRQVNEGRLKQARQPTDLDESREHNNPQNPNAPSDGPTESSSEIGGANEQDPYDETVFEELLMRFEEPNAMARWDSPLYTVPWDDASPPCDKIWAEVVQGVGKDGKSRTIRPNQAAVLTPATSPSHLYLLDRTTQSILAAIQAHQTAHPDDAGAGTPVAIPIPASTPSTQPHPQRSSTTTQTQTLSLSLPAQPLTFPYLQRLRRQFIALHRQQMGGLGMGGIGGGMGDGERAVLSEGRVAELFVGFLGERFGE